MVKKGKGTRFSPDFLNGFEKQADGSYKKKSNTDLFGQIKVAAISSAAITTPKQPVVNTPDFELNNPMESFITVDGIVAGLNGKDGLMRSHWTTIKKQKELYCSIISEHLRTNKARKHKGPVSIHYLGYKSSLMDWDNFCASFKHIGDSLVKTGIILEDNPKVVQKFLPQQFKCPRTEQRVVVIIQDILFQE